MKKKSLYHGRRLPAIVISRAVRWHFRFSLSLHDIEELLLERGVMVTYETVRCWCDKFIARFARCTKSGGANRIAPGMFTRCSDAARCSRICVSSGYAQGTHRRMLDRRGND